ncbi:MAG: GGDEF domain-containing protein [Solobacterium sp.]|nr:GGDEF domain-containing protein [Solobacterium sp.]
MSLNSPYMPSKKENAAMNTLMLVIHIGFVFWYLHHDMRILSYYNIVSILVFSANYILLSRGHNFLYMILCFTEIILFMIINVVCLGWSYGFQLYCFGFLTSSLLADSYIHGQGKPHRTVLLFIAFDFLLFIVMRIWTYGHSPIYDAGNRMVESVMYLVNAGTTLLTIVWFVVMHLNKSYLLEQKLNYMASHDELTGLFNRRYITSYLDSCSELPENIAILDIDYFKQINDTYGHPAGDAVLRELAEVLLSKEELITARWGGEEFLLLSERDLFEELRQELEAHVSIYNEMTIPWTVTIGVSRAEPNRSVSERISKADEHLYLGKQNGRNQVVSDDRTANASSAH